ncbi:MAG: hypothetical protein Q9P44_19370 [Anaerolineae bacterium]|nr:hypothetical protein [Anaerolineae bacterium]
MPNDFYSFYSLFFPPQANFTHYFRATLVVYLLGGIIVLAVATRIGIWLYDAEDLSAEPRFLSGQGRWVTDLAFTDDGNTLFSTGLDDVLRQWDVSTGEQISTFEANLRLQDMAITDDGQWVTAGGSPSTAQFRVGTLRVWDATSGDVVAEWTDLPSAVYNSAFNADGSLIVARVGNDLTVWDVTTGDMRFTIAGQDAFYVKSVFSEDGTVMVSHRSDRVIELWNVQDGSRITTLDADDLLMDLTIEHDGQTINIESIVSSLWIGALNNETMPAFSNGHDERVNYVAFSPDKARIASGGLDDSVIIWDVNTGENLGRLTGFASPFGQLSHHPNGTVLATAVTEDEVVQVWDIATGTVNTSIQTDRDNIIGLEFTAGGEVLEVLSERRIQLWDVQTPALLDEFRFFFEDYRGVTFSPYGRYMIAFTMDRTVEVWSMILAEVHYDFDPLWISLHTITFSRDGHLVASDNANGDIRIWSIETGEEYFVIEAAHPGGTNDIIFSLDGTQLISAGSDGTIRIWEVR